VAVEKLLLAKFAKIKSRQDALQTTFSIFLDIFYPPNFGCFGENGVFQQPQAIALKTRSMSAMAIFRQPRNNPKSLQPELLLLKTLNT
jgi:hypothetical protein